MSNPECKNCGLLKTTVGSFTGTGRYHLCLKSQPHDFGETPIAERQALLESTNIPKLIEQMEKDIEEYDLHDEGCSTELEDECDCERMKTLKGFGREWMAKVNDWWVVNATAHRKHCTPEGNKILTRLMGKKNRHNDSPKS